jgi:hypothetical protein
MLLTERHKKLLSEVYSAFIQAGGNISKREFRDAHEPDDLPFIDALELNFGYIQTDQDRYRVDLKYFLASEYGAQEVELAMRLASKIKPLYKQYSSAKSIFFTEIVKAAGMPEAEVRRALGYLNELGFLWFRTDQMYEVVNLRESIRGLKSGVELVPPYAKTKWEEDIGKRPKRNLLDETLKAQAGTLRGLFDAALVTKEGAEPALTWIQHLPLRGIVERDWSDAKRAFRADAYKATLIMSGGVAEGLLTAFLDVLSVKDSQVKERLAGWCKSKSTARRKVNSIQDASLGELIDLAKEYEALSVSGKMLSDHLRDFRNFIHPGKEAQTKGLVINKPEATVGLAAIDVLARDIEKRLSAAA